MTYAEVKGLLQDVRRKRKLCKTIREELEEIQRDIRALSLPAIDYSKENVQGGIIEPSVERIVIRLQEKQEAFDKALTVFMDTEDRLIDAITLLPPLERSVLTERYLKDTPPEVVAKSLSYSLDSIYRIQRTAIQRLSSSDSVKQ